MPRVREGTSNAMAEGAGIPESEQVECPQVTEEQQVMGGLEDDGHGALEYYLSQADGTRQSEVSG